jgi:CubicO group peptidase (beta-lactamase class C family)
MLIATLVDDGLLDWDTPIVEIYPDFELSDPESTRQVTIRHLLSMSSGIPDQAENEFDVETESAEDIFILLSEIPLSSQPGEQFSYSNISVSVAGYIGVLAAGGEMGRLYDGYAQLLQERIFDPIGMKTATLSVEEARANPNHSASHIFDENGDVISVESYDFTGDPLAPSGSIKASVLDMAHYMSTQVRRGVAPNGARVVSEQNLTETWHPQIEDDESGSSYGLGWGMQTQRGVEVIWHEGSYDNFSAMLIFVPEANTGMALLTNLDDPGNFLEIVSERFVQKINFR